VLGTFGTFLLGVQILKYFGLTVVDLPSTDMMQWVKTPQGVSGTSTLCPSLKNI